MLFSGTQCAHSRLILTLSVVLGGNLLHVQAGTFEQELASVDTANDRLMRRQKQPSAFEDGARQTMSQMDMEDAVLGQNASSFAPSLAASSNTSLVLYDSEEVLHADDEIVDDASLWQPWETFPEHSNETDSFSFEEFDPSTDSACEKRATPLLSYEGGLIALAQHDVRCPSGKHLTGFTFTRSGTVDKLQVKFACCKLVGSISGCDARHSNGRPDLGGALPALQNHEPECSGKGLLNQWQLKDANGQLSSQWMCCKPPPAQKVSACVTAETRKEVLTSSVLRLVSHPVQCTAGRALLNWKFKNDGRGKFNIQYTCCAIGAEPAPAGPTRWCTWGGDPHFRTFDGRRHDTTRVGYGQSFWSIRSKDVQLQYIALGEPNRWLRPGLTRGVAIGGRWIKGHRIIMRKDIPCLQASETNKIKQGFSTWGGFRGCAYREWQTRRRRIPSLLYVDNKKRGLPPWGQTIELFKGVKMRNHRNYLFYITLPWRMQIMVFNWHYYYNVHVQAPHLPEQAGQCGDNNGRGDPWLQDSFPVAGQENMFNYNNEVRGTSRAGAGGANNEPALKGCTGTKRANAEKTCGQKVAKGQVENEFLHICLFDLCFSEAGAGIAGANMDMSQETERLQISSEPREYKLLPGTCAGATLGQGKCACPTGKRLGKISSEVDQDAIMDAIVEGKTTAQVWLGARFLEGMWRWSDGASLTGFSNWDPSVNWRSPAGGKRLCIDRKSGNWRVCADNAQLNVICEDKKAFSVVGVAKALEARTACGPNHEMAMPKSAIETQTLWKAVDRAGKGGMDLWLGAKYVDGEWTWDDGSIIGEFQNTQWAPGQPIYSTDQDNFLCMDGGGNGRWKVCPGYTTALSTTCQTSRAGLQCPVPKLSFRQLGLTKFPMEGFSLFRGECYYIGRGDRTCHETCWDQIQGTCNQKGLVAAAKTKSACRLIVGKFGHLDSSSVVEVPGDAGCTWKDLGKFGGKTLTQAVLEVADAPSHCSATTSSQEHHRICSCDEASPDAMKYPSPHVMTVGETVRVRGAGYDLRRAFTIKLMEGDIGGWDEAVPTGAFLQTSQRLDERYSLYFDPLKKQVLRVFYENGKQVKSWTTWWALGPSNEAWAVDLQLSRSEWQVLINGRRYPELDLLRDMNVKVTSVDTKDVPQAQIMYFPQPAASDVLPMSFDSRNGCDDHEWSLDETQVVTFHMKVYFHSLKDMPCIRCEDSLLTEGNHVYMKNGKLTVALDKVKPRVQQFKFTFVERVWYQVAISYVAKERVLELYIDEQRVEVAYYTTATDVTIEKGQLGCAGPDTERVLTGRLEDFTMSDMLVPYRQVTGWCHELGVVPDGKVLKQQAQLIPCKGSVCRPDQDMDLCTEDRASCEAVSCPSKMVKKADRDLEGFLCTGAKCHTHECCLLKAGCETLVCGTGKVLKKDAAQTLCASTKCTDADKADCCDDLGKCNAFKCPAGYVLKDKAANIFCTDRECTSTSFETCCEEPGVCGGFRCPSGYVAAPNSTDRVCEGGKCLATRDLGICCMPRAFCTSYVCPAAKVPVEDTTARCQSYACSKADEGTCCASVGTCDKYKCPDGEILRPNAANILCHDRLCQSTNHSVCCTARATCDSLTCPTTHVKKDMPKDIMCMGAVCSLKTDLNTCCDRPASCATATCPEHYVLMHNASNLTCKKGECVAADTSTCCVKQGGCLSMSCPKGKIHTSRAKDTNCRDAKCGQQGDEELCCDDLARCSSAPCDIHSIHMHDASKTYCKGQICSEVDQATCCIAVGKCAAMACPEGQTHRNGAEGLDCEDDACQLSEANVERCCVTRARCDTLQCRWDYVPKHNASEVMCKAEVCTDTDDHVDCCVKEDLCSSFHCPRPNYVLRADANEIFCEGEPPCKNTTVNMDMCCEPVGICSELTCPLERVMKPGANSILCAGSQCKVDVDAETCCDLKSTCDGMACSQGLTKRHNASAILCDATDCSSTSQSVCCVELGVCTSRPCESGYIHKVSSERIMCSGGQCATQGAGALDDRDICCEPLAVCDPGICNSTSHIGRRDAASRFCGTQQCGLQDIDECCTERAKCISAQCPAKYVQVPDAKKKYCDDLDCQEQDYDQCCVEQARCNTYACPTGELHMYVSRPSAEGIFCQGWNCTYLDRDTCCTRRAACDSMDCPETYVHVAEAATLFCGGDQCLKSEIPMCCDERAVCSSFACPVNYRPKGGSSSTFCAGNTCTEAKDLKTCCEPFGHCNAFTCPSATVLRTSYDSCPALSNFCGRRPQEALGNHWCDAADRMTCESIYGFTAALPDSPSMSILCKWENNRCVRDYTAACPMNPVAVAAACNGSTELLCDNQRCTVEECCAPVAKCNTYECPHGTLPAPNAVSLNCQARKCDARDSQVCCQDLGLCKTDFSCPQDYVPRPNASDIFCDDPSCLSTDFQQCCEEQARCASMTCPHGYVTTYGADRKMCAGTSCTDSDLARCCDQVSSCQAYPSCPTGTERTANAAAMCLGRQCGVVDQATCCVTAGRCDTLACPDHYVHRRDAAQMWCSDRTCENTDFNLCCVEAPFCTELSCPAEYVRVPGSGSLHCKGLECNPQDDLHTCCLPRATCEVLACPENEVLIAAAARTLCAGAQCNRTRDAQTCCVAEGHCHSLGCPAQQVHSKGAEKRYCFTTDCSGPHDADRCCSVRAECSTLACSQLINGSLYVQKPNSSNFLCESYECTEQDTNLCCDKRSTCTDFDCPFGYHKRNNSDQILCADAACKQSDYNTCCEESAMCSTLPCPFRYVPVDQARTIACVGTTCSLDIDMDRCCHEAALCSSMECPVGYIQKPEAEELYCIGSRCEAADAPTCCAEEIMCSSFRCPNTMVRRPNAHTIACDQYNCSVSQNATCCAVKGICDSLPCPSQMVHREDASKRRCQEETCTINDEEDCCVVAATCDTLVCPAGEYEHVPIPEEVRCHGACCEQDADLNTCCRKLGFCESYKCPQGYAQRHNASSISCEGGICGGHVLSAVERCCVAEKSCVSLQCPTGFMHREGAEHISCQREPCDFDDRFICCVPIKGFNFTHTIAGDAMRIAEARHLPLPGFWNDFDNMTFANWSEPAPGQAGTTGEWMNGTYMEGRVNSFGQFIPGKEQNGMFMPGQPDDKGNWIEGLPGPDGKFVPGKIHDGHFVPDGDVAGFWNNWGGQGYEAWKMESATDRIKGKTINGAYVFGIKNKRGQFLPGIYEEDVFRPGMTVNKTFLDGELGPDGRFVPGMVIDGTYHIGKRDCDGHWMSAEIGPDGEFRFIPVAEEEKQGHEEAEANRHLGDLPESAGNSSEQHEEAEGNVDQVDYCYYYFNAPACTGKDKNGASTTHMPPGPTMHYCYYYSAAPACADFHPANGTGALSHGHGLHHNVEHSSTSTPERGGTNSSIGSTNTSNITMAVSSDGEAVILDSLGDDPSDGKERSDSYGFSPYYDGTHLESGDHSLEHLQQDSPGHISAESSSPVFARCFVAVLLVAVQSLRLLYSTT